MSQSVSTGNAAPGQGNAAPGAQANPSYRSYAVKCALIPGRQLNNGPIIGGGFFGLATDIHTELRVSRAAEANSYMGFSMTFPRGEINEEDGFGVCHHVDRDSGRPVPSQKYDIIVKFPRGYISSSVDVADNQLRARLPLIPGDKELSVVRVSITQGQRVTVDGLGKPFYNPGHPSHGWLNDNLPIFGDVTLLSIFEQDTFHLLVLRQAQHLKNDWFLVAEALSLAELMPPRWLS
ncbi:hypothetical protein QQS21_012849 [Conoideocrella luteorostrata]|uniref:Uncharacterized protein n=1 Tax=Conoideocrella luteorostrata TaxID=1105319 RepID=A0AAJ0CCR5_9HYPO|nr:hypothetical protein QQS21_012849 [Conoideocrella luteorostrata]